MSLHQDRGRSDMQEHMDSIIRLECPSVPEFLERQDKPKDHYAPTPSRKTPRPRIASLGMLRYLVTVCDELEMHLNIIARSNNLKDFKINRQLLFDRVLSDAHSLCVHSRNVLQWKGATNTPLAARLGVMSREINDLIDLIKCHADLALEHHELLVGILGETRKAVSDKDLNLDTIHPLRFVLTVTLPTRIDQFTKSALPQFSKQVVRLNELRAETLKFLEERQALLLMNMSPGLDKRSYPTRSPEKLKLPILRGFKYCQQLNNRRPRVISRSVTKEPSTQQVLDQNKENTSKAKPVIRPPTRIENRRVSGPTWEDLYGFKYENREQRRLSARIVSGRMPLGTLSTNATPARHNSAGKSNSQPRISSLSSSGTYSSHESFTSADTSLESVPSHQQTHMMLSSPDTSLVYETPLAGKQQGIRNRVSKNEIHIPRRRAVNF